MDVGEKWFDLFAYRNYGVILWGRQPDALSVSGIHHHSVGLGVGWNVIAI